MASSFVPSLKPAVEQCTSSARDIDDLTDHSDASVMFVSDADSDTETDPGEMSPEIGQCGCQRCDYGGGKRDEDTCGRDHYQCRKCSQLNSVSRICSKCHQFGGHIRHKKYFRLYRKDEDNGLL